MKEINSRLDNITSGSLVLIDELCRSTNPNEGLALSMAICEYILNDKIGPNEDIYVFYATHFEELKSLEILYSKVNCYQFDSYLDERKQIQNTFKLKKGLNSLQDENYGLIEINLN